MLLHMIAGLGMLFAWSVTAAHNSEGFVIASHPGYECLVMVD